MGERRESATGRGCMTQILSRLAGLACLLLLVASCTGADSTFGLGKKRDQSNAAANAQFPSVDGTVQPGAVAPAGQPSNGQELARVYFAPVVGAPVQLVAALSKRLGAVGSANGVTLVSQGTPGMTNEIKGYFSAFTENGSTSVIHVWDVVSPSGQRVHRIQGQEVVPGATSDPWASVTPETMDSIADKVMSQYILWLRSAPPPAPQNPA